MPIVLNRTRPKLREFQLKRLDKAENRDSELVEPDLEQEEEQMPMRSKDAASERGILRPLPLSGRGVRHVSYEGEIKEERLSRQPDDRRQLFHLHQLQHQQRSIVRTICGKNQATDPFNTSCIKVDKEIHALLQSYTIIFHPNIWHTEAQTQQAKGRYTFATSAKDIVRDCLHDEMNMYCVLALMASQRQVFEKCNLRRDVSYYMTSALATTRKRIECHQQATGNAAIINGKMIMNMFYLGAAEWYRRELDASLVHFRAVKQMVDRVGGLKSLDGQLREMIALGDSYLAAERLAAPLFDAFDFDPGKNAMISTWRHNHEIGDDGGLERQITALGYELTRWIHRDIVSDELQQIVEDMAEFISVFVLSRQQHDFPPGTAHWIFLRNLAVRNRLLAMNDADARAYALRVALIMWELMVMTASPRKRTIKLLAPKLKGILCSISSKDWSGHESVRCWILTIGSMSAVVGSEVESWFVEEIVTLMTSGWNDYDLKNEDELIRFSKQFFYLESIQAPMARGLANVIKVLIREH